MKGSLVIDIGNTRAKVAIFKSGLLIEKAIFNELSEQKLADVTTNHSILNAIFSITGSRDEFLIDFVRQKWKAIELKATTPIPIKNEYQTPETLGKDRIAAVVGAQYLYPDTTCLIVDAGTCITYDWLLADGRYLGGNIAPGLAMRLQSMHHFTAALPLVETDVNISFSLDQADYPIGSSTETALRNGALGGAIQELGGYIQWSRKKYGKIVVILTGGDANFFVRNVKRRIFAHPDLVLTGLNKILNFNEKH